MKYLTDTVVECPDRDPSEKFAVNEQVTPEPPHAPDAGRDAGVTYGVKNPAPVRPAIVAAALSCFCAINTQAATTATQSLESIRQTAVAFVTSRTQRADASVRVQAGALDSRLKLAACGSDLQAFVPPGARLTGNATVGVRCAGPKPWKIYVPVRTAVLGPVVVAARHLSVGETVGADALAIEQRDLGPLRKGYLADTALAVGQTVKRAVPAGAVIIPASLRVAHAVQRGQSVTLSAAGSGLDIRMSGRAMADGAVGQRIAVRNLSSGRIVEGLVRSPELVEVLLD